MQLGHGPAPQAGSAVVVDDEQGVVAEAAPAGEGHDVEAARAQLGELPALLGIAGGEQPGGHGCSLLQVQI